MTKADNRNAPFDLRFQGLADIADIFKSTIHRRLSSLYDSAREVFFDDDSRFVFFSDCHRGDHSRADAFAANESLFVHALDYYFNRGFTYFEVGDGDELWQNRRFSDVLRSHSPTFNRLHRFEAGGRLHLLRGNHDVAKRGDTDDDKDGMEMEDGLVLRHRRTQQELFVLHGHQADLKSDILSPISRAVVRHIWRPMQQWPLTQRIQEWLPGGANFGGVERRLTNWIRSQKTALICGHTHRPAFADYGDLPYFNTGSWIEPGVATGLEIEGGTIRLVRWRSHPITHELSRELVESPRRLRVYAS